MGRMRVCEREGAPDKREFGIFIACLEGAAAVARVEHVGSVNVYCGVVWIRFESGLQGLDCSLAAAGRASELDRLEDVEQMLLNKGKAVAFGELEHLFAHGERAHVVVFFGDAA